MSVLDDEVLVEFLAESCEHLDGLDTDLLALEQAPTDPELLAQAFRRLHTIKGGAGFLGLGVVEGVAHAAEDVLARLREGTLGLDPAVADALLGAGDTIRLLLARVRQTGRDDAGAELLDDCGAVTARLAALCEATGAVPEPRRSPEQAPDAPEPAGGIDAGSTGHVRVAVADLDQLMNLTSELVLARNALLALVDVDADPALTTAAYRVRAVSTAMQEAVTATRMQPVETVWRRLPRVARDLAAATGKRVGVEVTGADTELDKAVLEAIKDPLLHLVRNAVDHGIESPQARAAHGKPIQATLRLTARHERGQVRIEVVDDGRGFDLRRLARAARDRDPHAALPEDPAALARLAFTPGLSTAEQVTNVSGRGVGMDVVRRQVERIGGSVELATTAGAGTTVTLTVPLTTAIVPALLVRVGGHRYALAQAHVVDAVRLPDHPPQRVAASPVLRHRGGLLPLIPLAEILGLPPATGTTAVVLHTATTPVALVVDLVEGTEEIVVKPLPPGFAGARAFAGATLLGDGEVALIVDPGGVCVLAGVRAGSAPAVRVRPQAAAEQGGEEIVVATIDGADGPRRVAVPLADVVRLEQFPPGAVGDVGDGRAVRYRDGLMPLLPLIDLGDPPPGGHLPVLVCRTPDGLVGVVVREIHDITRSTGALPAPLAPAWSAPAVVDGQVASVLSVPALARSGAAR